MFKRDLQFKELDTAIDESRNGILEYRSIKILEYQDIGPLEYWMIKILEYQSITDYIILKDQSVGVLEYWNVECKNKFIKY